jgi:hypothetical protein
VEETPRLKPTVQQADICPTRETAPAELEERERALEETPLEFL